MLKTETKMHRKLLVSEDALDEHPSQTKPVSVSSEKDSPNPSPGMRMSNMSPDTRSENTKLKYPGSQIYGIFLLSLGCGLQDQFTRYPEMKSRLVTRELCEFSRLKDMIAYESESYRYL